MSEIEDNITRVVHERQRNGWFVIFLGLVMAAMVAAGIYLYGELGDAKTDIKDTKTTSSNQIAGLKRALDAQRNQFLYCRNHPEDSKKCNTAITPPVGQIGPQGVQGLQGLQGIQGPQGLTGQDGKDGVNGQNGLDGIPGKDGKPGLNGNDGAAGPAGPMGPVGPKGDTGDPGKDGQNGTDGKDGKDAPVITGFAFSGNVTECNLVVSISDGTIYQVPVPPQFCLGP